MSDELNHPRKKRLSKADLALWKAVTGDVQRLPGQEYAAEEALGQAEAPRPQIRETVTIPREKPPERPASRPNGLDKRTDERLRRGQMEIEARLDLHGMTQEEAYEALGRFIEAAYAAGRRCVLVITGKGRGGAPGVLKSRVPDWLREEKLAAVILQTHCARPQDGGGGALYVLLRRQR